MKTHRSTGEPKRDFLNTCRQTIYVSPRIPNAKFLTMWIIVALTSCIVSACASVIKSENDLLFEEFDLLPASKQNLMDAAYQSLQELYPYSLIMPVPSPGIGYTVDVHDALDFPLFPFFPPINAFPRHIEIHFKQSLGRTLEGSIITGFRYAIYSYPSTGGFTTIGHPYHDVGIDGYINDLTNMHDLDIVFRSELFKRRIEPVTVTAVM